MQTRTWLSFTMGMPPVIVQDTRLCASIVGLKLSSWQQPSVANQLAAPLAQWGTCWEKVVDHIQTLDTYDLKECVKECHSSTREYTQKVSRVIVQRMYSWNWEKPASSFISTPACIYRERSVLKQRRLPLGQRWQSGWSLLCAAAHPVICYPWHMTRWSLQVGMI